MVKERSSDIILWLLFGAVVLLTIFPQRTQIAVDSVATNDEVWSWTDFKGKTRTITAKRVAKG